jgi:replicative DNA helicase
MNLSDIPPGLALRLPPQSLESESSVLGSLMCDNAGWDRVADLLNDQDFYRQEHQLIYAAIGVLVNSGKPADIITVYERLQQTGQADAVGGLVYLNALAQYVASASNIRRYAEIVRERSVLRRLATAGDTIAASAFETGGKPVNEVLDAAEQAVLAIGEANGRVQEGFHSIDNIVVRVLDRISELADNPDAHAGLATGFDDFDRMTSGFQAGDLVVLAGRPGSGKTAWALNVAEHVAVRQRKPVAVFSMEMGSEQLGIRLIGSMGRIDQTHLRTGRLTEEEWPRLTEAVEQLRSVQLHVQETPGMTISDLRASARRLARQCGGQLGLVVVDYIQLMSVSAGMAKENRATAVGELSGGLKALAKELKCPVIALSQLSRKVEERTDKRPMLSDLRESGAIEQDADTVVFIYRDSYYNKETKEPGIAEIIIGKQRSGPTGTVKLAFVEALTKFENLAHSSSF